MSTSSLKQKPAKIKKKFEKIKRVKRETYKLEAVAQDRGFPPLSRTVEVQIDVVDRANNPPVWDQVVYGPIFVKENKNVGDKVVSVKARSVFSLLCLCVSSSSCLSPKEIQNKSFAWHTAFQHAPFISF